MYGPWQQFTYNTENGQLELVNVENRCLTADFNRDIIIDYRVLVSFMGESSKMDERILEKRSVLRRRSDTSRGLGTRCASYSRSTDAMIQ